ncbi:unnamed protein product, partial [Rotaria sp. Silwood1]
MVRLFSTSIAAPVISRKRFKFEPHRPIIREYCSYDIVIFFCFEIYRGNGDSIKHAHQLITALLKNSETELTSLLPSKNK